MAHVFLSRKHRFCSGSFWAMATPFQGTICPTRCVSSLSSKRPYPAQPKVWTQRAALGGLRAFLDRSTDWSCGIAALCFAWSFSRRGPSAPPCRGHSLLSVRQDRYHRTCTSSEHAACPPDLAHITYMFGILPRSIL